MNIEEENIKSTILIYVNDLVGKFLYDDRKEDEDLPRGSIETALINREITIDEIVSRFKTKLIENVGE